MVKAQSFRLCQVALGTAPGEFEITVRKHSRAQHANHAIRVTDRSLKDLNTLRAAIESSLSCDHLCGGGRRVYGDRFPSAMSCRETEDAEVRADIKEKHFAGAVADKVAEFGGLLGISDLGLVYDLIEMRMTNDRPVRQERE